MVWFYRQINNYFVFLFFLITFQYSVRFCGKYLSFLPKDTSKSLFITELFRSSCLLLWNLMMLFLLKRIANLTPEEQKKVGSARTIY